MARAFETQTHVTDWFDMPTLSHLIPDAAAIREMSTPDLAGYVLESLMDPGMAGATGMAQLFGAAMQDYAQPRMGGDKELGAAVSAAWSWLEANGLICRSADQDNEWYVPTARGKAVKDHQALQTLIKPSICPPTPFIPISWSTRGRFSCSRGSRPQCSRHSKHSKLQLGQQQGSAMETSGCRWRKQPFILKMGHLPIRRLKRVSASP